MPTGIAGGSLFTIGRTGRDATKLYALYLSFEHLRESLRLCFLCIGIIKIPDKPKRPADRSGVRICLAWSGLRDLNPRSLGPKPSAIPNFAKPGTVLSIIYIFSKNATQICSEGKDAFAVEGRDAFAVDGKEARCCEGREARCGRPACVRKAGRGAQGRVVGCRADAGRVGQAWAAMERRGCGGCILSADVV